MAAMAEVMEAATKAMRALFEEWEATRLIPAVKAAVDEAVARATAERDKKIAALEDQLCKTQLELKKTVIKLDQLEAYSRRNCINISGVPERDGEETDQLILDVAKAAGVNLKLADLDRSHRIGRPGDRPRNIIVRLLTHSARQRLLEARRNLSAHRVRDHQVLTDEVLGGVYLSECLTQRSQYLLFIARRLKASKMVWAAYSTNGRVKVRLAENEAPKTIDDISDLKQLVGDDAVQSIVENTNNNNSGGPGPRGNATAAADSSPREPTGTPAAAADNSWTRVQTRRGGNGGNNKGNVQRPTANGQH